MTAMTETLAGMHLADYGVTVALADGARRQFRTDTRPENAVAALLAAGCAGLTGVAAVPASWPLPTWFALQEQAQTAGITLLRVIADISAAGFALEGRKGVVRDAVSGLGARFRWEDGVCERRRMKNGKFPGVCFGGEVAGLTRDDDLPAQGALLQAQVLTGHQQDMLLLDAAACAWQVRLHSGWQTLVQQGQTIPALGCDKLHRGVKQLRVRAVGPRGAVWLNRLLPLPCDSGKTLEINVEAGQETSLRVRDKGNVVWHADLLPCPTPTPRQPWQRGLTLTSEEINALMVGLEEDDPS